MRLGTLCLIALHLHVVRQRIDDPDPTDNLDEVVVHLIRFVLEDVVAHDEDESGGGVVMDVFAIREKLPNQELRGPILSRKVSMFEGDAELRVACQLHREALDIEILDRYFHRIEMLLRSGGEAEGDRLTGCVLELDVGSGIQHGAVLQKILPLVNVRLTGKATVRGRRGRAHRTL
jgi:hypothetical protein